MIRVKFAAPPNALSKHLLLHVCCAPCATYPLEVLLREWRVTAYFYNPNIQHESEYQARLEEARRYFAGRVAPSWH